MTKLTMNQSRLSDDPESPGQGLVLGPVMFLVYIKFNCLPNSVKGAIHVLSYMLYWYGQLVGQPAVPL